MMLQIKWFIGQFATFWAYCNHGVIIFHDQLMGHYFSQLKTELVYNFEIDYNDIVLSFSSMSGFFRPQPGAPIGGL